MVIDKVDRAVAEGGSLWFVADVHASQDILGTPCCNGFTAKMLYRADVASAHDVPARSARCTRRDRCQVRSGLDPVATVGCGRLAPPRRLWPDGPGRWSRRWRCRRPARVRMHAAVASPRSLSDRTVCGCRPAPGTPSFGSTRSPTGSTRRSILVVTSSWSWRAPTGTSGSLVAARRVAAPAIRPAGYLSVIDPSTNRVVRDGTHGLSRLARRHRRATSGSAPMAQTGRHCAGSSRRT